ncbi:MAG: hypothetical protein VXW16_03940 [Bacteroidota bacterium]|nr:hypothetical protein [Bacteroidota bacterium]
MSQRVNIQFSIDLEELPVEIDRLINKFGSELETTGQLYNELTTELTSVNAINEINDLRLSLARADHVLDDVSKIITGFIRMNVETPSQEAQQPTEPTTSNPFVPSPDTLNNLEDKLKQFMEKSKNEKPLKVSDNQ